MFKKLSAVFAMLFVLIAFMPNASARRGWQGTAGSPEIFLIEVVKGNIPGHTLLHRFGKAVVGTTMVPIASSLKYPTPIAAVALEVISDDADDTAAGAGAREITVVGLDSTWAEITQVVATNGLTAVPLPIDMIRIYDWWVSASGVYATASTGSHEGTITIQEVSGSALWFNGITTPYPKGQSQIAGYTVPLGYRAYIFIEGIVADSTKSVDVMLLARRDAGDVTAPYTAMRAIKDYVGVSDNAQGADNNAPINAFSAKTDLIFLGAVSTGTASISVDYEVLLIADGY
jgi:hypothetical protein